MAEGNGDTGGTNEIESVGDEGVDVDESVVRAALFAAVEGGADGTERLLSCRPIVKLFFFPEKDTIQDGIIMTARDQREALLNAIRSHKFHKGYARRFFTGMSNILKKVVDDEDYVPVSAYESEEEENERDHGDTNNKSTRDKSFTCTKNQKEIVPDEESTEALWFMRACAMSVSTYLDGLVDRRPESDPPGKTYDVIDEAFAVGELLHDVLFSLQSYCGEEGLQVQTSVASLCEKWWHKNFADRDYMVVQLIPFLVVKSLDGSAQKSDVKRLFTIKEAFQLLDFEEETIAYLHSLLLRTVSSPLHLRMVEGRRFIAYLFHLHESLVQDLHNAIRVQIPEAKKTILEAYGDIYMRAWNESDSESNIRSSVEETALQDLMYAVIHIASPSMIKALHIVLKPFHDEQKSQDVEKLLYRMYGPILWRSLKARNPCVRVNAANVLAETFPLQDPSSDHVKLEKSVKRGTASLQSLVDDSDPRVRIAGAACTAKILTRFWDVLPTSDIRALLNHIVTKLSSDSSSSAVRIAAINAITTLLEAPQSHAVLRALLPALGNMIHDKVERVRLAVVRMLLRIKMIRGIKYYHVVPVDHLLARLAEEGRSPRSPQGPVTSALTSLMLNSYFPQGENISGTDQINRTLSFLSTHQEAAFVFYCNLATHLSVNSVSKLAAMLLRCLSAAVEADKKKSISKGGRKRKAYGSRNLDEDQSERDGTLTAADTAMMALVAETICTLWDSIESELSDPRHEACHDFLMDAFSGAVLTDAHAHFERKANSQDLSEKSGSIARQDCDRTCAAILRCAGRLPPKSVEGLSSRITSILAAFQSCGQSGSQDENLSPHVALLCLWGMTEDVAKSLASSIASGFGADHTLVSSGFEQVKRSGKRKSTRFDVSDQPSSTVVPPLPANVALKTLEDILCGQDPSSIAARTCILQSTSACSEFEQCLDLGTVYAERILKAELIAEQTLDESDISFVLKLCETYGRLILHKDGLREGPLMLGARAKNLLNWITNKVVPVILSSTEEPLDNSLQDLNISRISSVADSPLPPCSPSPLEPPRQRRNRNSTPLKFDTSFDSIGDHNKMQISSAQRHNHLSLVTAFSLIKSSCLVFSEWLVIGGEGGVEEVSLNASKWCKVLSFATEAFPVEQEVLPAFCRLASQLCRNGSNFELLEGVILNARGLEEDHEGSLVRKTVASVLSGNDSSGAKLMPVAVDAVVEALYDLLEQTPASPNEEHQLPITVDDLLVEEATTFKASLSAILSNQQASLLLGKKLLQGLQEHRYNEKSRSALFEAKCLWILCERLSGRVAEEFKDDMRKLDVDQYDNDLGVLVGEILDGVN